MQGFYIVLIILGIICVILSFILTEKLEGKSGENELHVSEDMLRLFLEKNKESLEQELKAHGEVIKEKAIEDTEKALNRLTNEKIMAVDEFSDSVLEKINQNHAEVIFLYNMLNEKERELKELVASVNKASNKNVAKKEDVNLEDARKSEKISHPKSGKRNKNSTADQKKEQESNKLELSPEEKKEEAHSREEILALHQQGLTITDIAKQLKMGKGEIKLIIDLYQGAR